MTFRTGMIIRTGLAVLALGAFAIAPAMAQTNPPADQGRSESLSNKLSRSGGVIAPPGDVDPGMRVPAPDPHPNSTPVIPPGATGGNTAK